MDPFFEGFLFYFEKCGFFHVLVFAYEALRAQKLICLFRTERVRSNSKSSDRSFSTSQRHPASAKAKHFIL